MTTKKFDKESLTAALQKLDENIGKHSPSSKIEIHCTGGAVLLMNLDARDFTHDIDAHYPQNEIHQEIIKKAVQDTADDLGLEGAKGANDRDIWMNNEVDQTERLSTSDIVVFEGDNFIMKSISLEEILAQKLTVSLRGMKDVEDAKAIHKEILKRNEINTNDDLNDLIKRVNKVKPFNDTTSDTVLKTRMEALHSAVEDNDDYAIIMEFPHSVLQNQNAVERIDNKQKLKI